MEIESQMKTGIHSFTWKLAVKHGPCDS